MSDEQTVPGNEGTTLREVLAAYEHEGYAASFGVVGGGRLECGSCLALVGPEAVTMSSMRRLEGASDPDDMLAVVALTCPECGAHGTATLGFGPAANPEDGEVLRALRDHRGAGDLPANSAPGETTRD